MTSQDQYTHRILTEIDVGDRVSQRSLSRDIGIALGLTNLLVRRLVRKGLIRIIRMKSNRVKYLLTPSGIAEKARMSRLALQNSIRFYVDARDRIHDRFTLLSRELSSNDNGSGDNPAVKPIIFYGSGEVAEIGYICLRGTDLKLIGVIDDRGCHSFFDVPVYDRAAFDPTDLRVTPYCRLVVMSFEETDKIRAQLKAMAIPHDRIYWI